MAIGKFGRYVMMTAALMGLFGHLPASWFGA
jgi:membrane protein YqaA with SNARE-associated domain